MKTFWVLPLFLIMSCGQRHGGKDSSTTMASTDSSSDLAINAKYFELESDLPICDESRNKELVYIKETSHFEYCDQTEWVVIDLKGPQGVAGKDGKDGKDATDGVQGVAGQAGKDGKDARTILSNEWQHPIDERIWFVGKTISYQNAIDGQVLCPKGARGPTDEEVSDAVNAGIMSKLTFDSYIIGPSKVVHKDYNIVVTVQSPFSQSLVNFSGDVKTIRIVKNMSAFNPQYDDIGWVSGDPNSSYGTSKPILCVMDED